jgi:hypothetical protein
MSNIQKWLDVEFNSDVQKTPQFTKFVKDFKKELRDDCELVNLEIASFSAGHFFVSGFLQNQQTGKYAYFNISDVRFFKNDWYYNVLVRTAQHLKDYTGGANKFTQLSDLADVASNLTA